MTCQERDMNLLLLALNELPLRARLQTAGHLRSCARCRARQKELVGVSGQIAGVLQSPYSGGRGTPTPPSGILPGTGRLPLLPLLAVVISLLVLLGAFWYMRAHTTSAPPAAQEDGCRPGLPNDRCK